ncbi:MAG: glycosyltransferase [Candidatus Micrarchaeota archaeon]
MQVPILEYTIAFVALYASVFFFLLLYKHRNELNEEPALLQKNKLPAVSIVIPVLNEAGTITKTLDAVFALNYPKNKMEVIVVDDGSTDNTVREVKNYGHGVKLLQNKHRGVGKSSALNAGIRAAKCELIATLDSDSFPEKNSLHQLISFFVDEKLMAVTAAVKVHEPKTIIEKLQSVEYIFVMLSRKLLTFVDSVTVTPGPFSVFRSKVFNKVGLFDESSILEDQEMAYRIQAHNYKIVGSINADVYTEVPSTFSQLVRQRVRWNRGGIRNFYKHRTLLSAKYGDLGTVVLPLGVITILLVVLIFASVLWQIITGQFFSWFSLEGLIYSFGAIQTISILILILGILWLLAGRKLFHDERAVLSIPKLLLFLIAYTYFMSIFWLVTFGEELFGKKQKW